jgi:predicted RNA binding protein YcfA (HicA-like mRNA interferase family)
VSVVPVIKSKELISALLKADFKIIRQTGSHVRLQHFSDHSRQTTIPKHNSDIPRWLLKEVLKQAKISVKEFLELL